MGIEPNGLVVLDVYLENEIECSVEDPQQFINELLEELYRIAMDEIFACLARQAALSLFMPVPG